MTTHSHIEALRLLARERLLRGCHDEAELLDRVADELVWDRGFERRLEREAERLAKLARAFAESKPSQSARSAA